MPEVTISPIAPRGDRDCVVGRSRAIRRVDARRVVAARRDGSRIGERVPGAVEMNAVGQQSGRGHVRRTCRLSCYPALGSHRQHQLHSWTCWWTRLSTRPRESASHSHQGRWISAFAPSVDMDAVPVTRTEICSSRDANRRLRIFHNRKCRSSICYRRSSYRCDLRRPRRRPSRSAVEMVAVPSR